VFPLHGLFLGSAAAVGSDQSLNWSSAVASAPILVTATKGRQADRHVARDEASHRVAHPGERAGDIEHIASAERVRRLPAAIAAIMTVRACA
jgi:hypothetical protein